MRPPQNAGEDRAATAWHDGRTNASMRPPQNAGEDSSCRTKSSAASSSFNEAPAERGGRLVLPHEVISRQF